MLKKLLALLLLLPALAQGAISGTADQTANQWVGSSTDTITLNSGNGWSATPTSGDLLILGCAIAGSGDHTVTLPSGFTVIQDHQPTSGFNLRYVYAWDVSNGTESSLVTTIASTTNLSGWHCVAAEFPVTDLDLSSVSASSEDVSNIDTNPTTSQSSGSATNGTADALAIVLGVFHSNWDDGVGDPTNSNSYVIQHDSDTTDTSVQLATKVLTSVASTSSTFATNGTGHKAGGAIAIFDSGVDEDAPVYTDGPACTATSDTINCTATATDASPGIDHYSGIYADGSTPSVAEIKSGTGTGFVASTADSDLDVGSGVQASTTSGANLSAETAYDAWLMAEDNLANQTAAQKVDVTTTAITQTVEIEYCDHVEPYYRKGFCPPELTNPVGGANVAATTSDTTVDSDSTATTLYWCISQSATRTSAEIKAGTNCIDSGSTASPSSGTNTFNATGLSAETSYYSHYVHTVNQQDSNVSVSELWNTLAGGGVGLTGAGYFVCDGGSGGNTTETDGLDSNDGLSMANAWLTTQKVNDTVTALGSDVYLCEGGVWEDQVLVVDWDGTVSDNVIIGCYYNNGGSPYSCDDLAIE